jgi:anti-sigma B factor antagonist
MRPISTLRLLHFELDGEVLIVAPLGDCSSLEAATLEAELRDILDRIASSSVTGLIVDLEQAPYFGSTMLGALIKLWRSMTVIQGRLALCNVSPAEQEVLSATRLDSVWSIYPTRTAALAALRTAGKDEG